MQVVARYSVEWFGRRGIENTKGGIILVYAWKLDGLYPVPAQAAGDELMRIRNERGRIGPADVVDESRPSDAVLHPCFEWRDEVAAEKWREQQARGICNSIVVAVEREDKPPMTVRAVYHVQGAYHPTEIIIRDEDKYNGLYQSALIELNSFRKKFSIISDRDELKAVFDAIGAVLEQMGPA